MKYAPDEEGNFAGQIGYGYISFEKFIDAVNKLNAGEITLDQLDARPLPTLRNTIATTAILEAGRRSLDEKRPIVADPPGQEKVAPLVQPVGDAVVHQDVKARIQQYDLQHGACGRVLALDVAGVVK